jgi:hypothetical protein
MKRNTREPNDTAVTMIMVLQSRIVIGLADNGAVGEVVGEVA